MALSDEKDYEENGNDSTKESGERSAIIADISFGVAAAAAITGIIILVVHKNKAKKAKSGSAKLTLSPVAARRSTGMTATISF
jgi:flagellar basal body-associated protein FliL